MPFTIHLTVLASIFLVVAAAMRIVVVRLGIVLGSAAVPFSLGAYAVAVVGQRAPELTLPALAIVCAANAMAAIPLALLARRSPAPTVFAATLLLQGAVYVVIYNWSAPAQPIGSLANLTNGSQGIAVSPVAFEIWVMGVLSACALLWGYFLKLERSMIVVAMDALRTDPLMAEGLGLSWRGVATQAVALVQVVLTLAGAGYSVQVGYVDPTVAGIPFALTLVALGLVASVGPLVGPLAAVVVLVIVPELLRLVLTSEQTASTIRLGLSSIAILVVLYRQNVRPIMDQRRITEL